MKISISRPASGPTSLGGRIALALFGLVFAGMGLAFVVLIAKGLLGGLVVYGWEERGCTLESVGVATPADIGGPYKLEARYRYRFQGVERSSEQIYPGYQGDEDASKAQRAASELRPGQDVRCWVDPGDPTQAALRRPTLSWAALFLLLPLVFVGFGLLMVVGAVRGGKGTEEAPPGKLAALSRPTSGTFGRGCAVLLPLVFVAFGLVFLVPFFLAPASRSLAARSWESVGCEILASDVQAHSDSDGTTYSVEVRYRYRFRGQEYEGNRYNFFSGSSSGQQGKQDVVDGLPVGSTASCWVDPDDPYDSVLDRGFSGELAFGLIPLLFIAVGLGVSWAMWRSQRPSSAPAAPTLPRPPTGPATASPWGAVGPVPLKTKSSPVGRLVGMTFVALFWNGIVGVFLVQGLTGGTEIDGCLMLFLVPFVLIGLGLLAGVPYQLLAAFNPRPQLTLSQPTIPLGGSAELGWSFRGATSRLARLTLELRGHEEASYRQGTSTRTDKQVFALLPLIDTQDRLTITQGQVRVQVPADTMHSFEAAHNKVIWTLHLRGEIARWPDLAEEIEVVVTPLGGAR
jgi:Protein of unknown function (DUF3592)